MGYHQAMSNRFAKRINWVPVRKDSKILRTRCANCFQVAQEFYKHLLYAEKQFEVSIDHHKRRRERECVSNGFQLFFFFIFRNEEYSKFVPNKITYHVVPAEYQCKLPMSGALAAMHSAGRKLSTIDEQDHDEATRRGKINQVQYHIMCKFCPFLFLPLTACFTFSLSLSREALTKLSRLS